MVGIAVVIVVVIVIGAVGAFVLSDQGILDLDFQLGQFTGGLIESMVGEIEETPVLLGTQNFDGNLAVSFDAESVLATVFQKILSGANFDPICYERIGDSLFEWEVLDVGDSTFNENMSIKIRKATASDEGLTEMWCQITRTGGDTFLIDIDGIIRANPRIDTCIFEDPDFDMRKQWVCRINLLDISTTDPNVAPSLTIRLKFFKEAFTSTLGCSTCPVFINQESFHQDPSNVLNNNLNFDSDYLVGQGEAGHFAGFVKALSQIEITVQGSCSDFSPCNAFDGTELEEKYDINDSFIEVPLGNGVQKIKFSDMDSVLFENKIIYRWMYDQATGQQDVAGANIIILGVQEERIIDFPVVLQTTMTPDDTGTGKALCVRLELEYVDSAGRFTTTDNTIELVAQSSNQNQCIIDVQD